MTTTTIKTADIAIEFAKATKNNDYELLDFLLHDQGEFQVQNEDNDNIDANKNEFIKWYKSKLAITPITDVVYDQCLHCYIGNKVVIFNDGKFPRTIKDVSERSKTGLMIGVKDDKIINMRFCFVFLKTDNKYQYECIQDKVKEFEKQGVSYNEAYKKVTGIDPSDYL